MSTLLAIPSQDMVHMDFMMCFVRATHVLRSASIAASVYNYRCSQISRARNAIVQHALNNKFDHIMWTDSDMIFDPHVPVWLHGGHQPIVGCTYRQRRAPFNLIHEEFEGADTLLPFREVKYLPGGMILVSTEVYRAIGENGWYNETAEHGEDYSFCERARAAGYQLWLDVAASKTVGHLGQLTVNYDK